MEITTLVFVDEFKIPFRFWWRGYTPQKGLLNGTKKEPKLVKILEIVGNFQFSVGGSVTGSVRGMGEIYFPPNTVIQIKKGPTTQMNYKVCPACFNFTVKIDGGCRSDSDGIIEPNLCTSCGEKWDVNISKRTSVYA